jgi:hypothetical protein
LNGRPGAGRRGWRHYRIIRSEHLKRIVAEFSSPAVRSCEAGSIQILGPVLAPGSF